MAPGVSHPYFRWHNGVSLHTVGNLQGWGTTVECRISLVFRGGIREIGGKSDNFFHSGKSVKDTGFQPQSEEKFQIRKIKLRRGSLNVVSELSVDAEC